MPPGRQLSPKRGAGGPPRVFQLYLGVQLGSGAHFADNVFAVNRLTGVTVGCERGEVLLEVCSEDNLTDRAA